MVLTTGIHEICTRRELKDDVWSISRRQAKVYSYDEAIDITGHGLYNVGLLVASALAVFGCVLDLFAVPAVISVAACDLQLTSSDEKILITAPFVGALVMAYPWGYISDTKGRRASMLASMWAGFAASCLTAFAPHWAVLALLKFISVCFSSCSLTTAYTLIGESCGATVKSIYFFMITSVIHLTLPYQMSLHYMSLKLDFSIDLGLIAFVPWRLLAILIALPLGLSAVLLHLHYESPKFLINAGHEREALDILERIWERNRRPGNYPVTKIYLNEDGNEKPMESHFWQSLWTRIRPLFKMPLLPRTAQLYYLCMVLYGTCGGLLSWFPYLVNAFINGQLSAHHAHNSTEGLCNLITHYSTLIKDDTHIVSCIPKSDITVVWSSIIQGFLLCFINLSISAVYGRRKVIMIVILAVPALAALGCAFISNNIVSLIAYFSIFLASLTVGIVFSYFVDLYPTSYRGMVSCLSMTVGRLSNIASVNMVGALFMSHCHATFYIVAAILFSGVITSCFLPSDKSMKKQDNLAQDKEQNLRI